MANLEMTLDEVIKKDKQDNKQEKKGGNAPGGGAGGNRDRRGFRGGR